MCKQSQSNLSLYWIVCAVSLGGLLFGFDAGVISGCDQAVQKEFALAPFWHGLVMAGALIGTVFGALAAGKMCDILGRKPTLVWMGVLFLVSAAGCAVTPGGKVLGPHVLAWMRFIGGIGTGGVSVAVPMYIAEIAPPKKRGRLVLVYQFCIVLGIVVSYISNYCVERWLAMSPEVVWRVMLGAECLPCVMYLAALVKVPESPHQARVEASAPLFVRRNMRPIMLCFVVAFFSQLSGVNAVNFYSPRIFGMIFGEGSKLVSLAGTIGVGIVLPHRQVRETSAADLRLRVDGGDARARGVADLARRELHSVARSRGRVRVHRGRGVLRERRHLGVHFRDIPARCAREGAELRRHGALGDVHARHMALPRRRQRHRHVRVRVLRGDDANRDVLGDLRDARDERPFDRMTKGILQ